MSKESRRELEVGGEANVRKEAARKLLHLIGLAAPIAYLHVGKNPVLASLVLCLAASAILEALRLKHPKFFPFHAAFKALARQRELNAPSGYLYFFLGASITVAVFNSWPAIIALTASIIGDVASALVGSQVGKVPVPRKGRTLEGTLAGALSIISLSALYPLPQVAAATVAFMVVETLSPARLDDNLLHPLALGAAAHLCELVIKA